MVTMNTTRPVSALTTGRVFAVLSNITGVIATWNDARITRKSLLALSERELADIGLTYADIDNVATRNMR